MLAMLSCCEAANAEIFISLTMLQEDAESECSLKMEVLWRGCMNFDQLWVGAFVNGAFGIVHNVVTSLSTKGVDKLFSVLLSGNNHQVTELFPMKHPANKPDLQPKPYPHF